MKSNYFTVVRFIMALVTVLAIFAQPYIPPKKLLLHPNTKNFPSIFAPQNAFRGSVVRWVDRANYELLCEFQELDGYQSCGFTLAWNTAEKEQLICDSAASDEDGDGWGWENEASCIVRLEDRSASTIVEIDDSPPPECGPEAVDPDGDGWGWEYDRSCIIPAPSLPTSQPAAQVVTFPACTGENHDPDKDGWGWENGQSCIAVETGEKATGDQGDAPECSSAAKDPDGDGWGWENHRSCIFSELIAQPQLTRENVAGIDLSAYDGIEVEVFYEGRAEHLRINMINFDMAYGAKGGTFSEKFMSAFVRAEDLRAGAAFVKLNEFSVPEWWVKESNAIREHAAPDFTNIVAVGVDLLDVGVHKMRVERMELVGERISRKDFLMLLMVLWGAVLLIEVAARYYLLRRTTLRSEHQLASLTTRAVQLEVEKSALHSRAVTDPLTGINNRSGFLRAVKSAYSQGSAPCIGLLLLDLDHFKAINDDHGHEMGDKILKEFAQIVDGNTRRDETLARWGGEEFVLLVPNVSAGQLSELADKLRRVVANHIFAGEQSIRITTSVGGALDIGDLDFEELFKRADMALYRAKTIRNQFVLG